MLANSWLPIHKYNKENPVNFKLINLIKQNLYISTECGHCKPNQNLFVEVIK